MFKRFFAALTSLSVSAEALAASFQEANDRFRSNLALDGPAEEAPQLPAPEENGKGGRRRAVSA